MRTHFLSYTTVCWTAFWAGLFLLSTALPAAAAPSASSPSPKDKAENGELDFSGRHIKTLRLVKDEEKNQPIRRADQALPVGKNHMSLSAGKYWISNIELEGGWCTLYDLYDRTAPIVVAVGQTSRPDVGAPLTPTIQVKRLGQILELDYKVLDGGGRRYMPVDRRNPPRFAVYAGDRQIGAGAFEYG